jgi:dihydrofolate reductase
MWIWCIISLHKTETQSLMNTMRNSNGNLIVDFPSASYCRNAIAEEKSVSFSTHSDGLFIKYPSKHEQSLRWYTSEDERRFRHQTIQDAIDASRKMADGFSNAHRDRFQDFVGLERLISRDVEERYIAMRMARKRHTKIVLAEQRAQRRHRRVSVEDLAEVSSISSQLERERARKVGILVASMHN